MSTILLIILILLLIGALPAWPYSSGWGYWPSGGLGLILLILLILAFTGRLRDRLCVSLLCRRVLSAVLIRAERDSRRRARISFQEFLHEPERRVIFLLCVRSCAIRGHEQVKVAHIGIVRCEKDAKIPSNAGEN